MRVLPTRWRRKPAGIEITSLSPYVYRLRVCLLLGERAARAFSENLQPRSTLKPPRSRIDRYDSRAGVNIININEVRVRTTNHGFSVKEKNNTRVQILVSVGSEPTTSHSVSSVHTQRYAVDFGVRSKTAPLEKTLLSNK